MKLHPLELCTTESVCACPDFLHSITLCLNTLFQLEAESLCRFRPGSRSMFIKSVYFSETRVSFALVGWLVICCPLKFECTGQQRRLIAEVAMWQDFPKHIQQKMVLDVY